MLEGGCHCGAVRYAMPEEVIHHSLCHCRDCRCCAGAPAVSWAAVKSGDLRIDGEIRTYRSSADAERGFCGHCGTGLFYWNQVVLPGLVDVQTATLEDPDALPLQLHVQVAERIGWMKEAHRLPEVERFPA